ncbi:MAG: hypothetical protein JST86_19790 [Bacteroidetes bacterium]|nr:hypothetical protein [Bacteroidota bacterium]
MKQRLLLFFLAGTLLMMFVMSKTGAPLKTIDTPKGIINLELAGTLTAVQTILSAWSAENPGHVDRIAAARLNTWLDFIFIFFYGGFFFFLSKKLGRIGQGLWLAAGKWCARFAIAAGLLDMLENTGMLTSLYGNASETNAAFTATASSLKWGLVLLMILYCLAGLVNVVWKGKLKSLMA